MAKKRRTLRSGIKDDWGKTKPFWCLTCGSGFGSVEQVFSHYSTTNHGNESMSVGAQGLSKEQQTQAFRIMNK